MTMPLVSPPLGLRIADLARDAAAIDGYVRAHADAAPFHLTAWSRAIARGCGQQSHYLIAERASGVVAGVLPLTHIRSKLFGPALVSAGFAVDGGILADDANAAQALAAEAWALAERLGCPSLELRGGPAPDGFEVDDATYVGFARPLAGDDEAELKAIPRKQRAEVRRALGNDLTVSVGQGERDLADHYRVYSESVRNLGTPVLPRALFRAVIAEFGADADILTVRHDDEPVASVLSLYVSGTVYPYWGGGTQAARALRANDQLYFALMRHARERGCTRFDFGRSKAGTGAAAFKKNWGFEPRPLGYAIRTARAAERRSVNPLDPKYRLKIAAWKRLPLSVANAIGPWIARGLG